MRAAVAGGGLALGGFHGVRVTGYATGFGSLCSSSFPKSNISRLLVRNLKAGFIALTSLAIVLIERI
jgi:hypothetical protein